jgi:hypothetical protein
MGVATGARKNDQRDHADPRRWPKFRSSHATTNESLKQGFRTSRTHDEVIALCDQLAVLIGVVVPFNQDRGSGRLLLVMGSSMPPRVL